MTLMHDPHPPTPNPQPPLRSSDAPLLRSSNLHRRFQLGDETLHVLRGVDVSVAAGQWVAVLGASGSGKSTLLHLLGGLDRPDEGEVVYADASIYDLGARALDRYRSRSVGFVFQFYHLLPELTAIENVLIAGDEAACGGVARAFRPGASVASAVDETVGRRASAGGDRAGDDQPAGRVAARRADGQP